MTDKLSTYNLLDEIGRGATGIVYRAVEVSSGAEVAIKVLHPHLVSDASEARLQREAALAMRLDHPNIVRVREYGIDDGTHYLVMDLVEGESLEARLRRGPLPIAEVKKLAKQLGMALRAAHEQGICHCDVKPANILLDSNGDARMTDFGVARAGPPHDTASIASTLLYAAPEILDGVCEPRSDLYSLGLVLVYAATGRSPGPDMGGGSQGDSGIAQLRTIDRGFAKVVAQLLQEESKARYRTAEAFLDALAGRWRRPHGPGLRRWVPITTAGAFLAVGAVVLGFLLLPFGHDQRDPIDTQVSWDVGTPWFDTGIEVDKGMELKVTAWGLVTYDDGEHHVRPEGDGGSAGWGGCPTHSLVAWAGNYRPAPNSLPSKLEGTLCLGVEFQGKVEHSGHLYVALNDYNGDTDVFADNQGTWTAHIAEIR